MCPGLCRKKECFILAANYLQQVEDLHEKEDIVKNIIMFYTKARSFKQLSRFYNQVAEVGHRMTGPLTARDGLIFRDDLHELLAEGVDALENSFQQDHLSRLID